MKTDWEVKKLCEIGIAQTGTTPKTSNLNNYGSYIPFVKPADIDVYGNGEVRYTDEGLSEEGLKSARRIIDGSVLMVCIGASIGKVGFVDREVTCNQQINSLTVLPNYYPKFFYYALSTPNFYNQVLLNSAQATLPIINKSKWENLSVSFPKSFPEQQRIVAILDEAFAAIDKAKENALKNLQNARALFESYLQSVFANPGESWEEKTLNDVARIINGYSFKSGDFSSTNVIKSVKITNVGVREFIEETDNFLPSEFKNSCSKFLVKKGDIALALTRSVIANGLKVAIIPESYNDALLNQRVAAIRVKDDLISSRYLYAILCTEEVKSYILEKAKSLLQPNLSINDLSELKFTLPPLNDQLLILTKLDALSVETKRLEAIYQQKLIDLDELKKAILQKAFQGELTTKSANALAL